MKNLTLDDIKNDYLMLKSEGLFLEHVNRFDYFLQQIESEWERYMNLISSHEIKFGMEIGTWGGGSFSTLTNVASDDATLLTLDLHEGMFKTLEDKGIGLKMLKKYNQNVFVRNYDSHDESSVSWTKEILGENKLDYLFIDGDHSYDGVKEDFYKYSPFVKDGGIISFHDIQPHGKGSQVDIFWREIKQLYEHIEIIENPNQTWAGIGILYK